MDIPGNAPWRYTEWIKSMKDTLTDFIDEHNRIVFSEKEPGFSAEALIGETLSGYRPRRVAVEGKWSVTPEHDLKVRLSGSDSRFIGRTIIFRGDILAPSSSGLFFRVRQTNALSGSRSRTIQLRGVWAVDSANRLTFQAASASGRYDVLRFHGAWRINSNNELSYRLVRTEMRTRTKKEQTLTFSGYWDITPARLVYRLDRRGDSTFSFRAAIQSRSVRAKEGEIRYRLGGIYSSGKGFSKDGGTLTIHGLWRLNRDLSVTFEIKDARGEEREVSFGVEKLFIRGRSVKVSLKDKRGRDLGLDVTFSRELSRDAGLFVSMSCSPGEKQVMGGFRMRFYRPWIKDGLSYIGPGRVI